MTAVVSVLHRVLPYVHQRTPPARATASDDEGGEESKLDVTSYVRKADSVARLNTRGSWLFVPSAPTAEAVAERCLEVLYLVVLVAAGEEGVGGASGGRLSGSKGQQVRASQPGAMPCSWLAVAVA